MSEVIKLEAIGVDSGHGCDGCDMAIMHKGVLNKCLDDNGDVTKHFGLKECCDPYPYGGFIFKMTPAPIGGKS